MAQRIRWEPKGLYQEIWGAAVTSGNGKGSVVTITALQELRLVWMKVWVAPPGQQSRPTKVLAKSERSLDRTGDGGGRA